MKKTFVTPQVELIRVEQIDVLTLSSGADGKSSVIDLSDPEIWGE